MQNSINQLCSHTVQNNTLSLQFSTQTMTNVKSSLFISNSSVNQATVLCMALASEPASAPVVPNATGTHKADRTNENCLTHRWSIRRGCEPWTEALVTWIFYYKTRTCCCWVCRQRSPWRTWCSYLQLRQGNTPPCQGRADNIHTVLYHCQIIFITLRHT